MARRNRARRLVPLLLAPALTLTAAPAYAVAADMAPDMAHALVVRVARCFSPPAGATGSVTVSFDLDRQGRVTGTPRVDGFASPGVGKAAVHAVLLCEPYSSLPPTRFTDWQHARIELSAGE
jgi:hypothetical protein